MLIADNSLCTVGLVDAIESRPELTLAGQADNGRTAIEEIRRLKPDVAVIDMKMPHLDGMAVMRTVVNDGLETLMLFLSGYLEGAIVYEAVEAGARGYISKDSSSETICDAIAAVAEARSSWGRDPELGGRRDWLEGFAEKNPLSQREREIVELTANGHSASDIADRLYLSPATVKTHLQRVYQKLGVSDRAAAVAEAMRRGIVERGLAVLGDAGRLVQRCQLERRFPARRRGVGNREVERAAAAE